MGVKVVDDIYKWFKKLCNNDETCVCLVLLAIGFMLCLYFNRDGFTGGAPLNWDDQLNDLLDFGILKKFFGFGPMYVPRTKEEQVGIERSGTVVGDVENFAHEVEHEIEHEIEGFANSNHDDKMAGLVPKSNRQKTAPSSMVEYVSELGPVTEPNFGDNMQRPGELVMGSEVESYGGWGPGYAPVETEFKGAVSFDAGRSMELIDDPVPLSMSGEDNIGHMGESHGQGGTAVITFYYAPWCPHCKSVMPHWEKLTDKHHGKPHKGSLLNFVLVNSDDEPDKVKAADPPVEGYPDLRVNGKPLEVADRTHDGILGATERELGL